jgi:hypothetical protein
MLKRYSVSLDQFIAVTRASDSLVAADALDRRTGRFAVKVPSLIEKPTDVLDTPIRSKVMTFTVSILCTRAWAGGCAPPSKAQRIRIDVIQANFADWKVRSLTHQIMDVIRVKTADISSILIEVTAPRLGLTQKN